MSHHIERCDCGAVLSGDIETGEGVCLTCLLRKEAGQLAEAAGGPSWYEYRWDMWNYHIPDIEPARDEE